MRLSLPAISLVVTALTTATLGLGTTACSSSTSNDAGASGGGDDGGCGYTSSASLTSPTVSFKNDVAPIFSFSCAISSSCHGGDPTQDISTRGLFLGCSAQSLDAGSCYALNLDPAALADEVYQGLVGAGDAGPNKPIETSSMPFVTAGDPSKSYLMHKLDNDLCNIQDCVMNNTAVAQAMDTPGTAGTNYPSNWCGVFMPYQVSVLEPSKRDTVRRWIAQGAMNN
jgi:hypothetical protein